MTYSKPIAEIIQTRFSCRTYSERPLEEATRQRLSDFAASTPGGPFGTRPRFELVAASEGDRAALRGLGTYGFIRGATGFLIGATREAEGNMEDFGYLMEHIILFATDLGLGTCWLGGTYTKSSFAKKIAAQDGEIVAAVAAVGYIAERRRAVDPVIRRGADANRRYAWSQLFFDGAFGRPLAREVAGTYEIPLEMVRLAPSASNKQPWRIVRLGNAWHFYLRRSRGYGESGPVHFWTRADMQRIDLGIAMCHFEITAREIGLEGRWAVAEPSLARPDGLTQYIVSWIG
jgi:nitroreductase